jgi:hypothetical protein
MSPIAEDSLVSREMDYELNRYDAYSGYAQIFNKRGMAKEARIFESLADLCFDKAQLLGKVDEMLDAWVNAESSRKRPDSLK